MLKIEFPSFIPESARGWPVFLVIFGTVCGIVGYAIFLVMLQKQLKRAGDTVVEEIRGTSVVVKEKVGELGDAAALKVSEIDPDFTELKAKAGDALEAGKDLLREKLKKPKKPKKAKKDE